MERVAGRVSSTTRSGSHLSGSVPKHGTQRTPGGSWFPAFSDKAALSEPSWKSQSQ